jgi:prolipoprotein diacylglyceryltransferase
MCVIEAELIRKVRNDKKVTALSEHTQFHVLFITIIIIIIIIITPWSRDLLEKLTASQPAKKFLAYYGTRRFITAFTRTRHLSLTRASSIQSMSPHPSS